MSKCRVCRGPAVIDLPRHNANFCAEHLQQLCRRQVEKAIDDLDMLAAGGARARRRQRRQGLLAVWDMLLELGYQADGLYIGLGIGEYSDVSGGYAKRFADERGLTLRTIDLRDELRLRRADRGSRRPGACRARRAGCRKRHLFDKAARDGGYDVVATGHNLDDEAAVLLGNTLRWDVDYLARQLPVLPAGDGFPRKVKPLVRLTERETAAWCIVAGDRLPGRGVPDGRRQQAPRVQGDAERLEARSPGTKAAFYLDFVENMAPAAGRRCGAVAEAGRAATLRCAAAARRRPDEMCAFCRLVEGRRPTNRSPSRCSERREVRRRR